MRARESERISVARELKEGKKYYYSCDTFLSLCAKSLERCREKGNKE